MLKDYVIRNNNTTFLIKKSFVIFATVTPINLTVHWQKQTIPAEDPKLITSKRWYMTIYLKGTLFCSQRNGFTLIGIREMDRWVFGFVWKGGETWVSVPAKQRKAILTLSLVTLCQQFVVSSLVVTFALDCALIFNLNCVFRCLCNLVWKTNQNRVVEISNSRFAIGLFTLLSLDVRFVIFSYK